MIKVGGWLNAILPQTLSTQRVLEQVTGSGFLPSVAIPTLGAGTALLLDRLMLNCLGCGRCVTLRPYRHGVPSI